MKLMNQNFCSEDATIISVSSQDPSFPASNLKHPFRSKRWRSTDVDSEWVVFDMITTEPIDSVLIFWSKEDGIKLSNTATVKIQANATNVWTSPAIDQTLTIDNTYMLASHYFTSDQNYRYWRVLIQDSGNPNGYVELGVVWLGKGLALPNAQNGFTYTLLDKTKVTTNDFGHTYGDEYPTLMNLDFQYQFLDYSVIQIIDSAYRDNGTKYPVVIVIDPEDDVFDKDHFTIYGKLKPSLQLKHVNYNMLSTDSMSVLELS